MTIEVALMISIISVAFSVFFGLKSNKRSDAKDVEERATERAEINVRLTHIAATTNEIKDQISSLVKDVHQHGDRLTKVEESVKRHDESFKRLHGRVDVIENRINNSEKGGKQ